MLLALIGSVLLLCHVQTVAGFSPHVAIARRPLSQPRMASITATADATATTPAIVTVPPITIGLSIAKSLLGAGIFSLSACITRGPGMVPAALLALSVGALSSYTFFLVGRAAADTEAPDNKSLWERTVGYGTTWIYDALCSLHSFGGCVQFYSTMTILVQWIAASMGVAALPYGTALWGVSAGMLPLCLARNLNALRPASAIGFAGVVYAVGLLIVRMLDGSYRAATGAFVSTATGDVSNVFGVHSLVGLALFIGSVNTAFFSHLAVPRFWVELRTPEADATATNATAIDYAKMSAVVTPLAPMEKLRTFQTVVRTSFAVAIICTTAVMLSGYAIFGNACDALLINNFAIADRGEWPPTAPRMGESYPTHSPRSRDTRSR